MAKRKWGFKEREKREMSHDVFRQQELANWQTKNFTKGETGTCDSCIFRLLAGMTEELGELSHAILKHKQGIRGITEEQMKQQVGDAFGDVIVYGTQLLSILGIDAEEAVSQAIDGVLQRDWTKDKVTGGTESCHKGGEHDWKPDMEIAGWKKCSKCFTMKQKGE